MLFTIPGKICPLIKSVIVFMFWSKENIFAFSLGSTPGFSNSLIISSKVGKPIVSEI